MIPQPNNPNRKPIGPSRMVATPPKSPLLGQGPSARPPPPAPVRDTARSPEAANARFLMAQKMGTPSPENRPMVAPKPIAPLSPQQQAAQSMGARVAPAPAAPPQTAALPPRYGSAPPPTYSTTPQQQAAAAMAAKAGGDYPNPEWQPAPAFMKAQQPQPQVPSPTMAFGQPGAIEQKPMMAQAPVVAPASAGFLPAELLARQSIAESMAIPRYSAPAPVPGGIVSPPRLAGMDDPSMIRDPSALASKPIDPSGSIDWTEVGKALDMRDPTKNPGPGYDWQEEKGGGYAWDEIDPADLPPGVSLDDPAWTYTPEEGWQYDPEAAYKADVTGFALDSLDKDLSEYGFTPEELQAQEDQIIRSAAEAKAKAAQQMAGRGLGGSGLEIAGFGNIDVGAISAMTDLQTENKALQIESRLNEIKTALSAKNSLMDDATRNKLAAEAAQLQKDMFEYDKGQQSEADKHTLLNNAIAQVGADKWDPEALAWAYDQLDAGASVQDVLRAMGVTGTDEKGQSTAYQQGDPTPGAEGSMGLTSGDAGVPDGYAKPQGPMSFYTPESQAPVEAIKAAYDQYVDSANQSGAPALSYGQWVYWNLMQSGTPIEWMSDALDYAT